MENYEALIEEAYLYGFPMIINYQVMHDYNINRKSGQFKAPFNEICNVARVYTPKDTAIVTPNSDTPYSMAMLDLRTEPIVISVPKFDKKRYYDIQFVDMYTNNYDYAGSRTTGNDAGSFLVAGPDWKGKVPSGIKKVILCETWFTFVIFRTQLFNPSDINNVKKIQSGYKIQTLSSYAGEAAPAPAPEIAFPELTKNLLTTDFPVFLNFILQFCPATGTAEKEEKPLRKKFASVGIGADKKFNFNSLSDKQKTDFQIAVKSALAKINDTANNVGKKVNGWQIGSATGNRKYYNGNWALRAAAAKLGIYGNDAIEAAYPFSKNDINGRELDCSRQNYMITFSKDQLPPVNAFWSITIYDGQTQLLIENPINRYLINSPMLPDLKFNNDGSLSIYVQKNSPGKDRESNWLPAPDGPVFIVMRLYWPKTEKPSVFPLGKGSWQPPGIEPVQSLNSMEVKRYGDKSLETIIRTDERYGYDELFNGPRGWGYWNYLEYPRAIQNPNLWPDMQSTYFISYLKLPSGGSITFDFEFPHTRYFQIALYREERNTFVSTGEELAGSEIKPEPGSVNPFIVGSDRLSVNRKFKINILASDKPKNKKPDGKNTLYAGKDGGVFQCIIRLYLSDQGYDGTGWGQDNVPQEGTGLPAYKGRLADGKKLSSTQVIKNFNVKKEGNTSQPLTADQWISLVNDPGNDPSLDPATSPARKKPEWEKYWTLNYSAFKGIFVTPKERAKIPFQGSMEGGGNPTTQYFSIYLSRKFGPVYVMRGKMPVFPDTYSGSAGKGLEIMPDAETQYWSIVSCEAAPSGQIVDGLTDMQVPLDKNRNYTIVVSRKEDRPKNATAENGVAWLEWSPRGEGLNDPRNRTDFGMLMMRIMANNPNWKHSPDKVTKPGMEKSVMGPYFPIGEYTDKRSFEKNYRK